LITQFLEHRMKPATLTFFVTPVGWFPGLVIDVQQATPEQLCEQDGPSPFFELELTDDDALELVRIYRMPTADLGRWAI
jgi:hypothetical protein